MFPPEEVSDQPEHVLLAELVREQVLRRTRQEVPHAVEVQVEEIDERDGLVTVRALLWVETESQKGILIGATAHDQGDRHGGAARARARARPPCTSTSSVRVRRSWRADDALLDRLGIN